MKILIVEDEQDLRETIRTSLLKEKFVVETAADYFSALDKINDYDYDCILLDIMLPGGSGLDLLRELKHLRRTDNASGHYLCRQYLLSAIRPLCTSPADGFRGWQNLHGERGTAGRGVWGRCRFQLIYG